MITYREYKIKPIEIERDWSEDAWTCLIDGKEVSECEAEGEERAVAEAKKYVDKLIAAGQ